MARFNVHDAGYEQAGLRVAAIHTSDRGNYKGCRRRWYWQSHLKMGLEPYTKASPLWFGSGVHFALESVHGSNFYPTGADAFVDFVRSSHTADSKRLPDDWKELQTLGIGMLNYYEKEWSIQRPALPTYVVDGVPQIEVQFEIVLPVPEELLGRADLDKVVYRGTMDRVAIHPDTGLLWIIEYKTAAQMQTSHFANDPQVTAYCWAAQCIYNIPCAGVVYQQHLKAVPEGARMLASGKVSSDARQNTTHRNYRQALIDMYGPQFVINAPAANINCLNELGMMEDEEKDPYVRRDRIYRNAHQIESEGAKILLETFEMIDPNTPLYPHAGRHCSYCPFSSPCTSMDDGSDWESELNDPHLFIKRESESNQWLLLTQHQPQQLHLRAVLPQLQLQDYLLQASHPLQPDRSLSLQSQPLPPISPMEAEPWMQES